jgi:hypothetical protein
MVRQKLLAGAIFGLGAVAAATGVILSAQPAASTGAAPKAALPAAPAGGEMGFVLSAFYPAVYPGNENCPQGYVNTNSQNYLASLPVAERAQLSRSDSEAAFTQRWKAASRGGNNTNLCTNYDQFPDRPLQKTVQGRTAFGLDLDTDDGKSAGSASCAHDSFTGPEGETGIDNQAYRVMGCMRSWRAPDGTPGDLATYSQTQIRNGEFTIVILLKNVDSLVRDDDVEVIFASSMDTPMVDAAATFVSGATFAIAPNPRWRNVLRGRIREGVLTTAMKDITVRQPVYENAGPRLLRYETEFSTAKLEIRFRPDGTIAGTLGGYLPTFYFLTRMAAAGVGTTDTVNLDCASLYNTLQRLADGVRNPKTGRCTKISTAFEIAGVPAFVKDLPARTAASVQ